MNKTSHKHPVLHMIQNRLIAGILVVVPLWFTFIALRFFFMVLDSFFAPLIVKIFGFSIPGLGFILLFLSLYLIGTITTNIIGKSFIRLGESILHKIPLVRNIYQGAKQLIQTISMSKTLGFKRVVFIEYPRKGLLAVGFVTNTIEDKVNQRKFVIVFLPTPPNPINGMFEIVPEQQVIETNISIEEGVKMVMSAGMVSPGDVTTIPQGQIL